MVALCTFSQRRKCVEQQCTLSSALSKRFRKPRYVYIRDVFKQNYIKLKWTHKMFLINTSTDFFKKPWLDQKKSHGISLGPQDTSKKLGGFYFHVRASKQPDMKLAWQRKSMFINMNIYIHLQHSSLVTACSGSWWFTLC